MFSHQNIATLSEVGPDRHRITIANQLEVVKNVLRGCASHRKNKTERKEDVRKTVDATRDLPLPKNKPEQNYEDGVNPQMHQALANLKYTLLLTNLAELPSKVEHLPIGIDRKIALLPSLEFLQEVDTSYLARHQNLPSNEQDDYDTVNYTEESLKTMFTHKVTTA